MKKKKLPNQGNKDESQENWEKEKNKRKDSNLRIFLWFL